MAASPVSISPTVSRRLPLALTQRRIEANRVTPRARPAADYRRKGAPCSQCDQAWILRRTRAMDSRDDGRGHDGTRAQPPPALFQQARNRIEDGFGQPVPLKQMAKAQNRTVVRHYLVAQLHPRATPHRLAVVDRIFRLRIRQIEPLLQEMAAQQAVKDYLAAEWKAPHRDSNGVANDKAG